MRLRADRQTQEGGDTIARANRAMTATANADVGPTPYYLRIYDYTLVK